MQGLVSDRNVKDLLKIIRGARNGFYYGGKVRLMHSIVISILFMKGSLRSRIQRVLKLTLEHALRIGIFVAIYKTICVVLKRLRGGKHPFHSFIAGGIGAFVINLDGDSVINQQITFYLLSRVTLGLFKIFQSRGYLPDFNVNRFLSLTGWGSVMALFFEDKSCLQPSLINSMQFLYEDSDTVSDWTDLVPVDIPQFAKQYLEKTFPVLRYIKQKRQEMEYKSVFVAEHLKPE